jgi:hypothetical protein
MIFLSLVPLITVLTSICILTVEPKCNEFECAESGFGCFCCTACHDHVNDRVNDRVNYYDDSSDSFHAYAKKS